MIYKISTCCAAVAIFSKNKTIPRFARRIQNKRKAGFCPPQRLCLLGDISNVNFSHCKGSLDQDKQNQQRCHQIAQLKGRLRGKLRRTADDNHHQARYGASEAKQGGR